MTATAATNPLPRAAPGLLAALIEREPILARYGIAMWLAMIPAALALGLDERLLREAPIWLKPLKFLASVGLFALTTAWFIGLLPVARRRAWPVRTAVWTLIAAGSFEIAYIVLQAALGAGSHYNVGDPVHAALYSAMAVSAIAMTATQPLIAWEIARHGGLARCSAWRTSVLWGLSLTFVLGTVSGMMLGGMQPPSGGGMPLTGWHAAGDLRPAHFVGLHAHQALPLAGAALGAIAPRGARGMLVLGIVVYVVGWAVLMATGLTGRGA
jgi:hypothetical protein